MKMLGTKLRCVTDGVMFWCPGCDTPHYITLTRANGYNWGFDQNAEQPTFTPSVLVSSGHYCAGHTGECWCTYNAKHPERKSKYGCGRCHSFVTTGRIQFLGDSTHALAGQTVDLPDYPLEDNNG